VNVTQKNKLSTMLSSSV